VLVHGHTGDQVGMSGLAMSFVKAGFAVLSIDLRGHGLNRRPFSEGSGLPGQFDLEIGAAVQFARSSPFVDGSRIALAGHSMGAGAVLEYATRDTAVDAVVMIAGSWEMTGPHRPPNAFFIYAENDLPYIPESSDELASRIAGQRVSRDRTYGDVAAATGVRVHEVAGANHGSIIRDDETVREVSAWLDDVWNLERSDAPRFDDPRLLPSRVALGAFLLVLLGVGGVAGRVASRFESSAAHPEPRMVRLVPLVMAAFPVLPFFAMWMPGFLFGTTGADRGVTYLSSVGIVLLLGLTLSGTFKERLAQVRPGPVWGSVAVGLGVVAAGYILFAPWAVTLRAMSLTPERALLMVWMGAVLIPFTLAFHLLTAGGSHWRALGTRLLGRAIVIAAISVGLAFEMFGFPTRMFLSVLVVNVLWLELIFGAYYASSRNVLAAAILEAFWLGWQFAAVLTVSL
jgi:dienelactone hydrolase